ncbi:MAG: hypothetical protein M1829_004528 [Trizodia sp. TS-e1964]|nr:MAG: hypothetical protein M1829_004528 [Trizodia sp. TS-e1964]
MEDSAQYNLGFKRIRRSLPAIISDRMLVDYIKPRDAPQSLSIGSATITLGPPASTGSVETRPTSTQTPAPSLSPSASPQQPGPSISPLATHLLIAAGSIGALLSLLCIILIVYRIQRRRKQNGRSSRKYSSDKHRFSKGDDEFMGKYARSTPSPAMQRPSTFIPIEKASSVLGIRSITRSPQPDRMLPHLNARSTPDYGFHYDPESQRAQSPSGFSVSSDIAANPRPAHLNRNLPKEPKPALKSSLYRSQIPEEGEESFYRTDSLHATSKPKTRRALTPDLGHGRASPAPMHTGRTTPSSREKPRSPEPDVIKKPIPSKPSSFQQLSENLASRSSFSLAEKKLPSPRQLRRNSSITSDDQSAPKVSRFSWTDSQGPRSSRSGHESIATSIESAPRFRSIHSWVEVQRDRAERAAARKHQGHEEEMPEIPEGFAQSFAASSNEEAPSPSPKKSKNTTGHTRSNTNATVFRYHPGEKVNLHRASLVESIVLDTKLGLV